MGMKLFIRHALILGLLGLAGAAAVVFLGLYNVSARIGHLPGVSWVLHTAYQNAVELRAPPPSAVPDLTSPDLAALGARHYDTACRFCHGTPGERQTATVRAMEPKPPPIIEAAGNWRPAELFWIVKHGVKMTGMPGWPTEFRDDDVWAVVAFLDDIDNVEADYASLVAPPAEAADDADLARCAVCHGLSGAGNSIRGGGQNQVVPRLDIQGQPYLEASLLAYRSEARESGIMHQAASTLDDEAVARLAEHYARSTGAAPPTPPAAPPDAELVEAGRRLALAAPPDPDVAACSACHGPWPTQRSPLFPTLAGQNQLYLETQLRLWRSGHRGGTNRAELMHQVATNLTDHEIEALAAFYASGQLDPEEAESNNDAGR